MRESRDDVEAFATLQAMVKRSLFSAAHAQTYVDLFRSVDWVVTDRLRDFLTQRHSRVVSTQAVEDGFDMERRAADHRQNSTMAPDRMWSTLIDKTVRTTRHEFDEVDWRFHPRTRGAGTRLSRSPFRPDCGHNPDDDLDFRAPLRGAGSVAPGSRTHCWRAAGRRSWRRTKGSPQTAPSLTRSTPCIAITRTSRPMCCHTLRMRRSSRASTSLSATRGASGRIVLECILEGMLISQETGEVRYAEDLPLLAALCSSEQLWRFVARKRQQSEPRPAWPQTPPSRHHRRGSAVDHDAPPGIFGKFWRRAPCRRRCARQRPPGGRRPTLLERSRGDRRANGRVSRPAAAPVPTVCPHRIPTQGSTTSRASSTLSVWDPCASFSPALRTLTSA